MEGGGRKRQYAVRSTIRSTIRRATRRPRRAVTCGLPSIPLPIVPTHPRRGVDGATFI